MRYDPVNANGQLIFASGTPTDVRGPATGTTNDLKEANFTPISGNVTAQGPYTITITAATTVPEPSTLALIAITACGAAGVCYRKARAARKAA